MSSACQQQKYILKKLRHSQNSLISTDLFYYFSPYCEGSFQLSINLYNSTIKLFQNFSISHKILERQAQWYKPVTITVGGNAECKGVSLKPDWTTKRGSVSKKPQSFKKENNIISSQKSHNMSK